eukprot:1136311-Pleurochrysis_carterae.AAC.4
MRCAPAGEAAPGPHRPAAPMRRAHQRADATAAPRPLQHNPSCGGLASHTRGGTDGHAVPHWIGPLCETPIPRQHPQPVSSRLVHINPSDL